jgi:hypothetical protein
MRLFTCPPDLQMLNLALKKLQAVAKDGVPEACKQQLPKLTVVARDFNTKTFDCENLEVLERLLESEDPETVLAANCVFRHVLRNPIVGAHYAAGADGEAAAIAWAQRLGPMLKESRIGSLMALSAATNFWAKSSPPEALWEDLGEAVVAALQHGDATVRLLGAHLLVNLAATLPCEVSNEVVCTLVCAVLERAGEEAAPGVAELLVEVALFWVKASPEIKDLAMGLGCEPAVRSPAAAELSRCLAG